ncbi:MAG: CRISPR-associated ring nuclease Crn1 [Sulfolobus sp.]
MVKLISTLGTSPGGVFESYLNLINGKYEAENPIKVEIDTVYIIRTKDPEVEFAWKLVKAVFACCGGRNVTVADIPLPITDIFSRDDYLTFLRNVKDKISKEDYVDITGGRKAMSVAAAIAARYRNANILTTIIPQNEYNRIQQLIKGFKEKKEVIEKSANGECSKEVCELISKEARTILLL